MWNVEQMYTIWTDDGNRYVQYESVADRRARAADMETNDQ